jgi:hypothetical protein
VSESHLRFMERTRPAGLDKEAVRWALAEIERLRPRPTPEPIMTDVTEPTEAELQHAIDAYDAFITRAADTTHFITMKVRREAFRAALTAAAQVRAQGRGNVVPGPTYTGPAGSNADPDKPSLMPIFGATEDTAEPDIDVQCKCGWAGKKRDMPWVATFTTTHHCPRCNAVILKTDYAASVTEPDQGPDALGLRKGEE